VTRDDRCGPRRFDDQAAVFIEHANEDAGIAASGAFPVDFLLKCGDVAGAFPDNRLHDLAVSTRN
jgi:hypothetical protein